MNPSTAEELRNGHDHHEDHTPAELKESAYRRGVDHGFEMARRILEKGLGLEAVEAHAKLLHEWRFREGRFAVKDHAHVLIPPWPEMAPGAWENLAQVVERANR